MYMCKHCVIDGTVYDINRCTKLNHSNDSLYSTESEKVSVPRKSSQSRYKIARCWYLFGLFLFRKCS